MTTANGSQAPSASRHAARGVTGPQRTIRCGPFHATGA